MSSTARLRLRRDTASGWTTANPVLLLGEVGIETDTRNFKVGNGSSGWTALQYYITSSLPLVRGQVSKMDSGTITIATQGAYVATGLTGTFDAATAEGMALGTADAFAVKNTSGATKLMQVYGSIDAILPSAITRCWASSWPRTARQLTKLNAELLLVLALKKPSW